MHLAGDLEFLHQIFGVPAGSGVGEGVVEAVAQHAVVELAVAQPVPESQLPRRRDGGEAVHDPKRPLAIKDQLVYISAMSQQTPVQLPRGRPRSFDTEAAVERAMGVFWSRGYHATALPDLLRATKLSRGSLYAAFGDKHSLFLRALDRYVANALTRMDIELDPRREPVDGLRAYLAGYVDRTSGANGRRGCLLVATAMELAGHDAEVDRRIGSFFKAMEARVADALSRAKAAGKLADGVEPSSAARILVCFVEGLRVVGKTAPTPITSQATVDALLDRFIR
jgi:TetR/AcrR family transcriptional repressor of nem operon